MFQREPRRGRLRISDRRDKHSELGTDSYFEGWNHDFKSQCLFVRNQPSAPCNTPDSHAAIRERDGDFSPTIAKRNLKRWRAASNSKWVPRVSCPILVFKH